MNGNIKTHYRLRLFYGNNKPKKLNNGIYGDLIDIKNFMGMENIPNSFKIINFIFAEMEIFF